jgi:hypothetical protein
MLCCIFEDFFENQCGFIIFYYDYGFLDVYKSFPKQIVHVPFFNKLYFVYCVIFGSSRVVALLVVKI